MGSRRNMRDTGVKSKVDIIEIQNSIHLPEALCTLPALPAPPPPAPTTDTPPGGRETMPEGAMSTKLPTKLALSPPVLLST